MAFKSHKLSNARIKNYFLGNDFSIFRGDDETNDEKNFPGILKHPFVEHASFGLVAFSIGVPELSKVLFLISWGNGELSANDVDHFHFLIDSAKGGMNLSLGQIGNNSTRIQLSDYKILQQSYQHDVISQSKLLIIANIF